jgi:hypothetical protein
VNGWHVVLAAAGLLLIPSGLAKLRHPTVSHRALRAVGLPSRLAPVRTFGLLELLTGVSAVVSKAPAAAVAVAVLYAGFAAFVLVVLWKRAPLASCGCFGALDTPPSVLHVAVDAGLAATASLAAAQRTGAPFDPGRDGTGSAIGVLVLAAVVAVALTGAISRASGTRATSSPLRPR